MLRNETGPTMRRISQLTSMTDDVAAADDDDGYNESPSP